MYMTGIQSPVVLLSDNMIIHFFQRGGGGGGDPIDFLGLNVGWGIFLTLQSRIYAN
jgi:hypothetical protein